MNDSFEASYSFQTPSRQKEFLNGLVCRVKCNKLNNNLWNVHFRGDLAPRHEDFPDRIVNDADLFQFIGNMVHEWKRMILEL
jgi:hypothetical protein